jgi:hypothetical protein
MSVRRTLLLFVCLLMPIAMFGQSSTGSVSGNVTDDSASALPGVTITTENAATGATRSAVTNASGYYQVGLLPPGRYTVTAVLDGFQSVRRDVTVNISSDVTLNLTLRVGVAETVTVTASAPLIGTHAGELGRE